MRFSGLLFADFMMIPNLLFAFLTVPEPECCPQQTIRSFFLFSLVAKLVKSPALCSLLWRDGWTRWPTEVPSNPYHSVILCYLELGLFPTLQHAFAPIGTKSSERFISHFITLSTVRPLHNSQLFILDRQLCISRSVVTWLFTAFPDQNTL